MVSTQSMVIVTWFGFVLSLFFFKLRLLLDLTPISYYMPLAGIKPMFPVREARSIAICARPMVLITWYANPRFWSAYPLKRHLHSTLAKTSINQPWLVTTNQNDRKQKNFTGICCDPAAAPLSFNGILRCSRKYVFLFFLYLAFFVYLFLRPGHHIGTAALTGWPTRRPATRWITRCVWRTRGIEREISMQRCFLLFENWPWVRDRRRGFCNYWVFRLHHLQIWRFWHGFRGDRFNGSCLVPPGHKHRPHLSVHVSHWGLQLSQLSSTVTRKNPSLERIQMALWELGKIIQNYKKSEQL